MDVKDACSAIGKERPSTSTPRQTQGDDVCRRECEGSIEPCVDHGVDLLYLACRTAHSEADYGLIEGGDHPGDHTTPH